MRYFGTVVRGVRMPVIKEGDDIVSVVSDTLMKAIDESGIKVNDRDVIGITESVVARAQGNYATVDQFAKDVRCKMGNGPVGLVFPILSRNRFLEMLKAIASGVDELIVQLSYPSDEVGNPIISFDDLDNSHRRNARPVRQQFRSINVWLSIFAILHHHLTLSTKMTIFMYICNPFVTQ